MFKKPKRNFRTRRKDTESELTQEGEEDGIDTSNGRSYNNNVSQNNSIPGLNLLGTEKPKDKKKEKASKLPKVPSVTSMLSFEQDDGDSEMFQIKKPKHSRHIAKQLKKASQREKEEVEDRKPTGDSGPDVVEMQLGSDAEGEESEESDQERDEVTPSLRNILEGGQIPDAAMIHLIRKKRQQMAREMTEEFIPVDEKVKETSTSRLIREEDNDRSDEEEDGERLNFAVNSRETELRHIQDTILAAEEGSHSEGSDQESEWEKQQILKGVKVGVGVAPPPPPTSQAGGDYYSSYPGYVYNAAEPGMFGVQPHVPISYTATPSTGSIDVKKQSSSPDSLVTVDQIKRALKERLEDMTSVHRAHVHERDDMASRFEASEANIIELDDAKAGLEERYRFFQEMRGYVRDLVECFNEKVPAIEKIEKGLFTLLKQCSEKLVKRRQEDIKDQSQDYISNKAALAPNLAAMSISSEDQAKQRRAAEREARRARRRRSRQANDPRLAKEHNDGMSTDDEVNHSEVAKYKVERERLLREAELLFDNVVDDFHEAHLIMSKFERWKREQSDSYEEAYIGLCLPKLFTPLVRLKLVDWNPLENAFADVEAMSWYSSLVMYACHDTGGALLVEDSDIKLIPSIIEKVLLPKLTDFAESVWDPLSSQQTKNLAGIVRRLISDYPTVSADSKNTQALVKAIVLRMRKTLDDDVFMPLYPKQMLENRLSGQAVFFHRQLSSSIKLLTNMLLWSGVVSSRTQQELSLDGLLNRYLLLALHNSHINSETVTKCETIIATFPNEWFAELKGEKTIPKLEMFARYLEHAAAELYKTTSGGRDSERREMREMLKRIARMLVNIHAIKHAMSLASLYSLKISLTPHH